MFQVYVGKNIYLEFYTLVNNDVEALIRRMKRNQASSLLRINTRKY